MLDFEKQFHKEGIFRIVGIDEAGRGPLAGPVCAAAVIFHPDYENPLIDDSKKLNEKKREALYDEIIANALSYGVAMVDAKKIDEVNIREATKIAMKEALSKISVPYDLIITDAMPLEGLKTPLIDLVKADAQCLNVAAASILAKVTRDRYMKELESLYPMFSFSVHKGYGTKKHMEELEENGPIEGIHRKSFAPVASFGHKQLKLF